VAFLLYQITNLVNGKYYIGAHEGSADDGYMGSGKAIKQAIRKYGLHNFKKDVLAEVSNKKFLFALEQAVVSPEFINQTDTYNMCVGGTGSLKHPNKCRPKRLGMKSSPETRKKISEGLRAHYSIAANREKQAIRVKETQKTPEYQLKMKAVWADENLREKRRQIALALPQEVKDRITAAHVAGSKNRIVGETEKQKLRDVWKDPEYHALQCEKRRTGGIRRYQNPAERKRQSMIAKAQWQDPNFRAKMAEARERRYRKEQS
jgi:hypothetical protein